MSAPAIDARLQAVLAAHPRLAIAVSGGVDSMLLAYCAHQAQQAAGGSVSMFHAVSPAVPGAATTRVQEYAKRFGWSLHLIDAEELANPRYVANPVNRCYYCKSNLYSRIRSATDLPIASGTNLDDLGDFRPGLTAAAEAGVFHPYVEARVTKAEIYTMAAAHGLEGIATLPAQPCLSSRVETGVLVDAATLRFIEDIETALPALLPGQDALRCRVTARGVAVECASLPDGAGRAQVETWLSARCTEAGRAFIGLRPYRRGSAFLRVAA